MNRNQSKSFVPSRQFTRQVPRGPRQKTFRPPVTPQKQSQKSSKKKTSRFDLNTILSDILTTFSKALVNPTVLLTFAIATSVIINHNFDSKTGYLYTIFSGKEDGLSQWIYLNIRKLCGFSIFVPTIIDIPKDKRAIVAIATFLWVFLVPEYFFTEYIIQSLLLHTYFKVSLKNTRIVIVLCVVAAWFCGFMTFKSITPVVVPAQNGTRTRL
uniref:Uncharacterized protein n=1 Tax=Barley aphid RNA virus 1 TaxID=2703490 RepID=A0A6F8QHB3_9VIRU|nr:hypothetical protein 2 [Barley aphid RNA virus 1]